MSANDPFHGILTITIPIPYNESRKQGIYASNTSSESGVMYFRTNRFEKILIEKISKDLDIKPGSFARFCTIRVAQELEKHQHAYLESLKS